MAIADLAASVAEGVMPGSACQVCRALAALPESEAQGLRDLMANHLVRFTQIAEWVAADEDNPLDLHSDAIGKHARGRCAAREKLRGA